MSWSSDFRSIILRGKDYFFFNRFLVGSRQCLTEGVRFFANIFTQRYTLQIKAHVGRIFFSISQQIKVNGVTLDECILPYHFIVGGK